MQTLTTLPVEGQTVILRSDESRKRKDQSKKRPRVHEKIQAFHRNALDGVISPILRLKINRSLCNFKCEHCCEEPYMSRDLKARTGAIDPRKQMEIADYAELSRILPVSREMARYHAMLGVEIGVAFTVTTVMFAIYANLSTKGRLEEGL